MPDFEQDIIRTVKIQTQVNEEDIRKASSTLDGFYKKYQSTSVKVDTKDFFQAIDAVRSLRKELDSTKKSSPHMEGIIGHMSSELERAGQQFEKTMVRFTNGDIAHGLNEAVDKITSGLSVQAVDLGDFLSAIQKNIRSTVDSLKELGAIKSDYRGENYLGLSDLNTTQLESAIQLMQKLKESQSELDDFEVKPLKGVDLYSGTSTSDLSSRLEKAKKDLTELKRLNLETMMELYERRDIISSIHSGLTGRYESWEFDEIKGDKSQYDSALSSLREYVSEREDLLQRLQTDSYLFTNGEYEEYTGTLTTNISTAKTQLQELQQLSGKGGVSPIGGDFTEVTEILGEIKESLQTISDVFKNESSAMSAMVDGEVSSFKTWSEAIVAVYNNLNQLGELVDTISQKDFNVTNITNPTPAPTQTSKRQNVKQLKAEVTAEMQHVKTLYEEIDKLLAQLSQEGLSSEMYQLLGVLNELDAPIYENFEESMLGQMADAKTKVKIENLLVTLDGYIDKLTAINKLREKYGLGEWQDPFAKAPQSVVQPATHQEESKVVTPVEETQRELVPTGNAEAQQMANLKSAVNEVSKAVGRKNAGFIKEKEIVDQSVDAEVKKINELKIGINEVSKAIGRKNAGFIKEKEIVNSSVDAEEAKLRELVSVIINEIGNALDDIKVKFAQSFVVPELDKNNLQTSFDEIYNKFIDLKDKIQTMEINIGIDTANITTAIQEALYAKEIAKNYEKADFFDLFKPDLFDFSGENVVSQLTGEIFSESEAKDMYLNDDTEYFVNKLGTVIGTMQDVIADIVSKQVQSVEPEQENCAQVIVEAINTQGGRIVESIKLLLPKNIFDNVDTIDEKELINAFQVLVNAIKDFGDITGRKPRGFFESIRDNDQDAGLIRTPEVDDALRTLGLLSDSGEIKLTIPDTGYRNLGVAIGDKIVASSQSKGNVDDAPELQKRLDEAYKLGAAVPRILSLINEKNIPAGWWGSSDAIFQLQERAPGTNIHSKEAHNEFLGASPEQIDRLIHTFEVMAKVGLYPDFIGDNILFDDTKGFSLVDLETTNIQSQPMDTPQDMVKAFLTTLFRSANEFVGLKDQTKFEDLVMSRLNLPPEKRLVNADTIAAERMAGGHPKAESKPSEVKLTPTMDEGAVAKVVKENVAKTPATVKVTPVVDDSKMSISEDDLTDQVNKYLDFARNDDSKNSGESDDRLRQFLSQYPLLRDFEQKTGALTSYKTMFGMFDPDFDISELVQQFKDFAQYSGIAIQEKATIDTALQTQQAVNGESQSAVDAAKTFVDAANAKKQFVEANKQVADSAKESAKAVEEEVEAAEEAKKTMTAVADDTAQLTDWDKEIKLQPGHNQDPFALSRSKTDNVGNQAVRTVVETWGLARDEDGKLTGEMELNTVKIINDFKKRTDAITKESEKIKTAQAYLQKFLTQFNNKTMGKGSLLSGYQDLADLANSSNFKIDDIAKAEQMMSNLDAEYNKVVQAMRKGSSSMNPFVNAINGMDKMEDVLRGISLQFRTLNQQPEWLKKQIIDLYKQLDDVSAESDIYKFAEGFGNLKVSINSVVESIRQQRTEQKLALSDFNALVKATKTRDANTEKAAKEEDGSAWKSYYMDRAAEQQKIIDAIRIGLTLTESQETQLNAMAEKHALILRDINGENSKIEEQKQKYEEIMRLLEQNRADQSALDSGLLGTNDKGAYQQIINEDLAKIETLIANADLNPEQTKSVKQLRGSIEDDRIAKVKEYINLLELQHDYEKKAAKEDDSSKMQSFYNKQANKFNEKSQKIDINAIANQEEKNKLLAIEEAHQRAIAEILAKKNAKPTTPFGVEDEKIQKKYEAGYLSADTYGNWQKELAEYRNYMTSTEKIDEDVVQSKKQHLMQLYDTLTKMSNASKSFFTSGGEILPEDMWLDKSQIDDMSTSLMSLYNNISGERFEGMTTAVTRVRPELGKLFFTVDDGNGSLSQYVIHVNQATGATKLLADSTKPTLTVLQRFGQTLKKDFTGLLTAVMGGISIHTFVQYMRQGINYVRELDLALTELKKVTDETEETYDRFLDTASQTSARIGKTITEMTSATAEFAKLGYNIEQASAMAESALVYANVGDNVDVETGSQSIISTLKAFGIEANNTMSIVDKFNEVGKLIALR